jgi:lipopolysaccharide/colanic/teichoic acid biosynthesis glycosyltransferase
MTVAAPTITRTEAPSEPHVWGAVPLTLHDRLWASRGVQVVRPGERAPAREGPVLYLLLAPAALVEFDLDPVIKRLHWMKPRAVRVRILDRSEHPYRERVKSDVAGRLVEIRREYHQQTAATGRAWITAEPAVAKLWHEARSPRDALDRMRRLAREHQTAPLALEGSVQYAHAPRGVQRWLAEAAPRWRRASAVFADVYEFAPGVWAHESASIAPTARFVGPVWVGAGRTVEPNAIVIGPTVMADDPLVPALPLEPVPWEIVKSPSWELPSIIEPGADMRRIIKRLFDIVFSACVLAATAPLYPLIMMAIYLEDGRPFFFAHARQTLGGRDFPCYKFRTMCRDAERMKKDLVAANVADGPQFFIPDDPRLLRVGRLLRKWQLDELPQFWNVLLGQMSVVGPRPSPDKENQYCPAWREARLSVRPGITGLWQVRRTREPLTDFQEWIRYDLEYVKHQSLGRDLGIIIETVRQILR